MYAPNIPCRSYQEHRALPLLDMVTPSENDLVQTALILETLRQNTAKCWYVALWVVEEVPQWC